MSDDEKSYAPRPGMIPGVPINLGGHMFVLAPLGLRAARELEARAKEAGADQEKLFALGIDTILVSLHRNYPDITIEELNELVDVANIVEAQEAITGTSGMKRVMPGELPARG